MSTRNLPNQRGFTLIEVLVAFTVFAVLLGSLFQVMSGALQGVGRSDAYGKAALWAQSKLSAIGIETPIEEGTTTGQFDDQYSWELNVSLYQGETGGDNLITFEELPPVELYHVELVVSWGELRPRQTRFTTLRSTTARSDR